jgi:LysM repeat protein
MIRARAAVLVLLAACSAATPAPIERRGDLSPSTRFGGAPAPAIEPVRAATPAAASGEPITVARGQTLFQLSEEHQLSLRALIDANALEPPFQLSAGQTLTLPPPNLYVVRRGDTLNSIARRHNIQPRSLALLNGLREPYRIAPGDELKLPGSARDWETGAATPAAAATPTPAASSGRGGPAPRFVWPADGSVIDGFGPKGAGRRNDGINIAAREGAPVRAAADGLVVYAGDDLAGYGNLVLIKHDDGWVSAYAHNRVLLVREEQSVARGETIAEAGRSGAVDSPQLHFEVRRAGAPVDPASVLPPRAG